MAAAAAAVPAPLALAAPAPTRAAAPAHRTQFSVPGGAAPGGLDPDEWTVPRDCPAIESLPFLSCVVPAAPAEVRIVTSEVVGVVLAATTFNVGEAAVWAALRRVKTSSRETGVPAQPLGRGRPPGAPGSLPGVIRTSDT